MLELIEYCGIDKSPRSEITQVGREAGPMASVEPQPVVPRQGLRDFIEKISPAFDDVLKHLSLRSLSVAPAFFGLRAGLSDRFLDEALLPRLRDEAFKPVLIPLERRLWMENLGEVQTRSLKDLEDPVLTGAPALRAYKELRDSLDTKLRSYLRPPARFHRGLPRFAFDSLLVKSRGGQPVSVEILEEIRERARHVARRFDPICYPGEFLTMCDARTQSDALKVIARVVEQASEGVLAGGGTGVIILVELFSPIEHVFADKLRYLMREWMTVEIVLWLHAAIHYTPRGLIDQFQNHIVLQPSPAELEILAQAQSIDGQKIRDRGGSRQVAIVSGPCVFPTTLSWEVIPLSELPQLEEQRPVHNLPMVRELITAAFDDEALTAFCLDNYRYVYEQFSTGMSKVEKIRRLLDHCVRRSRLDELLTQAKEHNPEQFSHFEPRLRPP